MFHFAINYFYLYVFLVTHVHDSMPQRQSEMDLFIYFIFFLWYFPDQQVTEPAHNIFHVHVLLL